MSILKFRFYKGDDLHGIRRNVEKDGRLSAQRS